MFYPLGDNSEKPYGGGGGGDIHCTFCDNFWKAHKNISVLKMIRSGYSASF